MRSICLAALGLALVVGMAADQEARWEPIRRAFGQQGEIEAGYLRINLPRSDLRVRIGNDTLSPAFEFTSYVGFVPVGASGATPLGPQPASSDATGDWTAIDAVLGPHSEAQQSVAELARGIAAALLRMHSVQRSRAEH